MVRYRSRGTGPEGLWISLESWMTSVPLRIRRSDHRVPEGLRGTLANYFAVNSNQTSIQRLCGKAVCLN